MRLDDVELELELEQAERDAIEARCEHWRQRFAAAIERMRDPAYRARVEREIQDENERDPTPTPVQLW